MTEMVEADDAAVVFTPPGPGFWELETTHHGLRPLSPLVRDAYVRGFETGIEAMLERYGLPLARIRVGLVEGCFYVRPQGVGEGDKPGPTLPTPFMWLIARLHPEMRRRNRAAATAWAERRWRTEVDGWFDDERGVMSARNLELQRVEPASLDDAGLADHLAACLVNFADGMRRNLDTHGGDLVPVGDLVAHGERWGIEPTTMASLLTGSSPATVETAELLRPVALALAGVGSTPASIDPASIGPVSIEDVRALGPEVAAAVDEWTEQHAWRLLTSDDVDRPTLAELPSLRLQALLAAVDTHVEPVEPADPAPVRARVPADERALFDALLEEARYGNRQRDDVRGLCWNWPGGLVRRAMLEAGRRLVAAGRLHDVEHAAELAPHELDALVRRGVGPDADALAGRAAHRDRVEAAPPPRTLGDPEAPPPFDALPAPMARAALAVMANLEADVTAPQAEALHGTGIGDEVYRGRACVVRDAGEAAARLEPGDVLVAPFTGPSFNSLVPVVGALVVEEGGALCHAAIVAREFGVPAVVGALGAMSVPDGAEVEVDPTSGAVRILPG
jgi:rifampicin phosphotransferase